MQYKFYLAHTIILVFLLTTTALCSQTKNLPETNLEAFPQLSIKNDSVDIEVSSMQVNIKVMGNIAITSYDITFFNPSNRVLEGELNFPLKANQQIVGFSMDIEGELRKGVVVEKDKGRQVFESIVREGIDPGLLEKTSGNNFRARVFPILANKTKRIVINCQEELTSMNKSYVYQLPMQFSKTIEQFSLRFEVIKGFKKPIINQNDFTHLKFEKWHEAFVAEVQNQKVHPNGVLSIELPYAEKKEIVLTSESYGEDFFYASIPYEVAVKKKDEVEYMHLLWDVSGSGLNRNIDKEIEMLAGYFKFLGNTKVFLSTFNHRITAVGEFLVEDGNALDLFEVIKNLQYDGASRMDNIIFDDLKGQEIIMVADGLSNLGDLKIQSSSAPLSVINSSLKANHSLLTHLAESNAGAYIDLSMLGLDEGINKIIEQPVSLHYRIIDGLVDDCFVKFSPGLDQVIITGKLLSSNAKLKLEFIRGNELIHQKLIEIKSTESHPNLPISRIWAMHKINQFMIDKERNKEVIISLAKQYGVVTDYTSLMVLERVEDYVRFEIEPPAELKEMYDELMLVHKENQSKQVKDTQEAIKYHINDYKQWWNTDFPITKVPPKRKDGDSSMEVADDLSISDIPITRQEENRPPPPPVGNDMVLMIVDSEMDEELMIVNSDMELDEEACDTPPRRRSRQNLTTTINATPWDSTASYMSSIFDLDADDVFAYYLSIKDQYPNQPSFYLDVSSYLFKLNKTEEAVSVIGNVAELQLENAEIMRIVGHKLLQQEQWELAVLVFQGVLEMRPEELQSFRDLALAYEKVGEAQDALDLMISVLDKHDLRGNKALKGIIANEINCLINRNEELHLPDSFNKAWRYNMPVDIRIVLSWSTDNSDVDLWITEPSGEICSYSYNITWLGGRLSQDITSGYGPEEYLMKVSKKGTYKIQANYFSDRRATISGPITLHVEIFQNYGKSNQTSRQVVLQLKDQKQVIDLGEVVVK